MHQVFRLACTYPIFFRIELIVFDDIDTRLVINCYRVSANAYIQAG